ncbi:MAG: S8 family serine peptidase, partial [Balneolaceae bacterium]|nr:S8 family serine peptidase [Balneolaceae bacterium]
ASYSNFGFTLDVLATGTSIESTVFSDRIEPKTGTSMSTPVVSGLAGLIKSLNPSWTPQRIASQIRASASSVDFSNANELRNKLGTGKVNAFAAVDRILPGIRITSRSFINNDGEKLGLNEDGSLELHLENFGASTSDLTLSLESIGASGISIQNTRRSIGAMATGEQRTITFSMRITESFDPKEVPVFKINFDDNTVNYADFNIIEYDDILYETLAENGAMMSVGSDGTIGFTDPLSNRGGVGFVPRRFNNGTFTELENLLFEGGLILETNDKVFDAVRTSGGNVSRDFQPVEIFRLNSEGELANLEGSASFTFGNENTLQFGTINLTAFAINDPEIRNVVFLKYDITNPSSFLPLNNLYLGLFNDWDIGDDAFNNSVAWSAADSILYLFDEDPASTLPMVAVAHLGPISSALAIENPLASGSDSVDFGIFDGFTDSEKSISLKAGLEKTAASNNDVSAVVASGPFTLNTNATVTAGFVYAFGDDLAELRDQITAARNRNLFEVSETGLALAEQPPATTRLFQNYPNPFNPVTRLRVDLAEPSDVSIKVYDILGRQVATLVDGRLDARTHIFTFDGSNLGSGLYFARMNTGTEMQTIKLLLVK